MTQANKLSGKFFFSNQPSRDPLTNVNALTRYEVEETTYQRTFSLTDIHVFGPRVVMETLSPSPAENIRSAWVASGGGIN